MGGGRTRGGPSRESGGRVMKTGIRWLAVLVLVAGCGGSGSGDGAGGLDLAALELPDYGVDPDIGSDPGLDPGVPLEVVDDPGGESDADSGDADAGDVAEELPEVDVPCVPNCEGKECGSNGCGDLCGYCPYGYICNAAQICRPFCEPDCEGKLCGSDGCNGLCGECDDNEYCGEDSTCILKDCEPQCDGRVCGPDGCGWKCGDCDDSFICLADGQCTEDLNCYDITAVGTCVGNQLLFCEEGILQKVDCDPSQGLVCAYSAAGKKHDCVFPEQCTPQCAGKTCGPDKCGGTCGECAGEQVCSTGGVCGDPCDGVTGEGICLDSDTKLAFCHQGILLIYSCYNPPDQPYFCKWNPSAQGGEGAYDCL